MSSILVIGKTNIKLSYEISKPLLENKFFEIKDYKKYIDGACPLICTSIARLGAEVSMLSCIGDDIYSHYVHEALSIENVKLDYLRIVNDNTCGINNKIQSNKGITYLYSSGANSEINDLFLKANEDVINMANIVIVSELNFELVEQIEKYVHMYNNILIYRYSRNGSFNKQLLKYVDFFIIDETNITRLDKDLQDTKELMSKYPNKVIIIKSRGGISYYNGAKIVSVPACKLKLLDNKCAIDAFVGAFAYAIYKNQPLYNAVVLAGVCHNLCASEIGEIDTIPNLKQINNYLIATQTEQSEK